MSYKERTSFVKDVLKGVLVVVVLSLTMAFLAFRGAFAGLEGKSQDFFWLGHGPTADTSDMVVLEIDDPAYAQFFKSTSPMSPAILTELVRQIALVQPAVLGIDVLTTSDADGGGTYRRFAREKLGTKTVWISGEDQFDPHPVNFLDWISGKDDELVVKPTQVLGYGLKDLGGPDAMLWGPAIFQTEQDLKLRRFPRAVMISDNVHSLRGAMPKKSWAQVVAQQYCDANRRHCKHLEGDQVYLRVAGKLPPIYSLTEFFICSGEHVIFKPGKRELLKAFVSRKIALLGGAFSNSGDFHDTTEGRVPGIFINARAIAAEIHGVGFHDVPEPRALFLDMGFGFAVVLAFTALKRFGFEQHRARTMMIGSALTAVATMAFLYFTGYMFSVPAVVIVTVIQQLWDFWREDPVKRETA